MIDLGGSIPCEITFMTRPSDPSLCGLLEKGSWTREKLVKEIIKKSDENAENVLDTFLEKERDLKKDKNLETVL